MTAVFQCYHIHTHAHTHPHSHMYNRIFCFVLLHLAYTTVNTQQVYIVVVKYADDTSSGHFVTILLYRGCHFSEVTFYLKN